MRTSLTKVSHQYFPHKTYEFLPVFYTQIWCVYQQLEKSKVTEHLLPLNNIWKKSDRAKKVRYVQREKKLSLFSFDPPLWRAHLFGIGKAMAVSISNHSKAVHMSFTVVGSSKTRTFLLIALHHIASWELNAVNICLLALIWSIWSWRNSSDIF